jgi:hypothetical protein
MPYAGCILLRQTSPAQFQLENTDRPGTSLLVHGGQLENYITYNEMLRAGRQGLVTPIGYNQFAQIFNSAPGIITNFAYIPDGQETLLGGGPGPNHKEFCVEPSHLYNVRQVAARGSQVLSPNRAGIMMQMLWKNAEASQKKPHNNKNENRLGIERGRGGKRRRVESEPMDSHVRATSVAASTSGLTDYLDDLDFDKELTPLSPDEAPVASTSSSNTPSNNPSSSSQQDHTMADPIAAEGPSEAGKPTGRARKSKKAQD